jgi:H+/Cl- antiporter ClcA
MGEPTATPPPAPPELRSRAYLALVAVSVVLGAVVAAVAAGYVWLYHEGIHLVWETLPHELGVDPYSWWLVIAVPTLGGVAVGIVLLVVPGRGGPSPVAGHAIGGSTDPRIAPAAAIATIVSLVAGASLGPEAALVTLASAIGGLVAMRLSLADPPARVLSGAGTAGVLGAIFGTPLAGAMLMLELLTLSGALLYAVLIPGLVAAVVGIEVFEELLGEPFLSYQLPPVGDLRARDLGYAALLGVGGAIVGRLFMTALRATHRRVDRHTLERPVLLASAGGLVVGLLALGGDHLTLFSGESSLQTLIDDRGDLGIAALAYVLVAKLAATVVSMTTGFRGGQIFPVMFLGAAFGVLVAELTGDVPDGAAIACGMVAATVAVMRVPIAAILIVTFFVGVEVTPVVVIAAVAAYIVSFDLPLGAGHDEKDEVVAAEHGERPTSG